MKKSAWIALTIAFGFGIVPLGAQEESEMVETMESMDYAYKGLKRATGVEGVKAAREGQAHTLAALDIIPEMIEKMPEGKEKSLAVADYRRLLGLVFLKFVELEKTFLEGNDEAVRDLARDLKSLRKEGHNRYIEDE